MANYINHSKLFIGNPAPLVGYMRCQLLAPPGIRYIDVTDAAVKFSSTAHNSAAIAAGIEGRGKDIIFTGIRIHPNVTPMFGGVTDFLAHIRDRLNLSSRLLQKVNKPMPLVLLELGNTEQPGGNWTSEFANDLEGYLTSLKRLGRKAMLQVTNDSDGYSFLGVSWTTSLRSNSYPTPRTFVSKVASRHNVNLDL